MKAAGSSLPVQVLPREGQCAGRLFYNFFRMFMVIFFDLKAAQTYNNLTQFSWIFIL